MVVDALKKFWKKAIFKKRGVSCEISRNDVKTHEISMEMVYIFIVAWKMFDL